MAKVRIRWAGEIAKPEDTPHKLYVGLGRSARCGMLVAGIIRGDLRYIAADRRISLGSDVDLFSSFSLGEGKASGVGTATKIKLAAEAVAAGASLLEAMGIDPSNFAAGEGEDAYIAAPPISPPRAYTMWGDAMSRLTLPVEPVGIVHGVIEAAKAYSIFPDRPC